MHSPYSHFRRSKKPLASFPSSDLLLFSRLSTPSTNSRLRSLKDSSFVPSLRAPHSLLPARLHFSDRCSFVFAVSLAGEGTRFSPPSFRASCQVFREGSQDPSFQRFLEAFAGSDRFSPPLSETERILESTIGHRDHYFHVRIRTAAISLYSQSPSTTRSNDAPVSSQQTCCHPSYPGVSPSTARPLFWQTKQVAH
jgi:hypothetical protein